MVENFTVNNNILFAIFYSNLNNAFQYKVVIQNMMPVYFQRAATPITGQTAEIFCGHSWVAGVVLG